MIEKLNNVIVNKLLYEPPKTSADSTSDKVKKKQLELLSC